MIRALHTADWHYTDSLAGIVGPAIEYIVAKTREIRPDFAVIAGDLTVKRGIITPQESLFIRDSILNMAEVCPVIVIPGNHDISNRYDRVDAVTGLLARLKADNPTLHDQLYISTRPECFRIKQLPDFEFYTLPHPSKYIYLSKELETEPAMVNAALAAALENILKAHAVQATRVVPHLWPVLIGHGTISGGIADSERVLTNENDLAIDRKWLPDNFGAIMYGHLHKRQRVGRAVYCGSPAPLTFAQDKMIPSFELWDFQGGSDDIVHGESIEIPVAHQMLTIDITREQFENDQDPNTITVDALADVAIKDAMVRVRIEIPRERAAVLNRKTIEQFLDSHEVHNHKVVIEPIDPIRIRAEDMNPDLDMDSMLGVWSKLDDHRMESLPLMKEINQKVTGCIPHEDLHLLSGIDYQITQIRAVNFKPLIDVNVQFDKLGKVICIVGDNHIGKSQLAETERFVFWKQLRRGTTLDTAVRLGTKQTDVSIWFRATKGGDPQNYLAKRTLKLDNKGVASSTLLFTKQVNGEWLPVNEGSAGETQAALEKMVGTYSMYRTTRFGSQHEIDLMCNMTPSEMKDTLQESMNFITFDLRRGVADSGLKKLREEYENVTMNMERLAAEIAMEDDLIAHIKLEEESRESKQAEIDNYQQQLDEAQVLLTSTRVISEQLVELNNQITNLDARIQTEEAHISEASSLLAKKGQAEEGVQRLKELRAQLEQKQAEQDSLSESLATLTEERHAKFEHRAGLSAEITACSTEIINAENSKNELQNTWQQQLDAIQQQLDALKSMAELTDEVPCNGMEIQSQCKLLTSAVEAKGRIPQLEGEAKSLKDHPPNVSLFIDIIKTTTESKAGLEEEFVKLVAALKVVTDKHQMEEEAIAVLKNDISSLRTQVAAEEDQKWEEVQRKVLVADTNMKNAQASLDQIRIDREALVSKRLTLSNTVVDTATLSIKVDSLGTTIKSIKSQQEMVLRQLGALNQNLNKIQKTKEQAKELEEVNRSGLARINAYVHYLAAVSRDGIPYLLMEKALPRFEAYANGFLCVDEGFASPLRVKIAPVKDTQSGKEKGEVVITFVDDRGRHPLSESSGFQRIAIGYALRAANAKIQAESTGITIKHCIFDEGWGAFHESNMLLARRMIEKLGDEFGQFFYITHVSVLQEVADTIIEVKSADGGAMIEIR